ncbi:unnamed protein product [Cuscuta epithymum]|uniref:Uncharacterized protein n=1 Tax=Cuscuta epithymum TaxID=186058 RepID=A0AAV0G861_9ASTE|nr:unnamed protein product [Cuscuta epithymum]
MKRSVIVCGLGRLPSSSLRPVPLAETRRPCKTMAAGSKARLLDEPPSASSREDATSDEEGDKNPELDELVQKLQKPQSEPNYVSGGQGEEKTSHASASDSSEEQSDSDSPEVQSSPSASGCTLLPHPTSSQKRVLDAEEKGLEKLKKVKHVEADASVKEKESADDQLRNAVNHNASLKNALNANGMGKSPGDVQENDEQADVVEKVKDVQCKYPLLVNHLNKEFYPWMSDAALDMLKEKVNLTESSRAAEVEEKWTKLLKEHVEICAKVAELVALQTKMVYDAMKK